MHGQHEYQEEQDEPFGKAFEEVKAIGGPGRRIVAFMMDQMGDGEQPFVVQQPVHPIKIGVMNDQTKDQADQDVREAADLVIHQRIVPQGGKKNDDGIK